MVVAVAALPRLMTRLPLAGPPPVAVAAVLAVVVRRVRHLPALPEPVRRLALLQPPQVAAEAVGAALLPDFRLLKMRR